MTASAYDHRPYLFASAAIAVLVTAVCVSGLAWAEGEWLPLAIMLAALPLPVLFFTGVQTLVWNERYAFYGGILIIVLQCATLRVREIEDKTIDFQILIKLACIGSMVVLSASALLQRWPFQARHSAAPWFLFFLYMVFTSIYAAKPSVAFVETASNICAFLYLYCIVRFLGAKNLVGMLVSACFILCVISIVAYVVNPQLGRMSDWVNGAFIPTSRLTGIFGTANAAGASAAVGLMLTVLYSGVSPRRPLFYLLTLPMLFCLLASNNRMSVAAMGIGFLYVYVAREGIGLKLAVMLFLASVGAMIMASFGDEILSSVSRSGSADEITSGTGRTRIWAVVIDLWLEQPLFGYGAGSAKFILPSHPLLFKAAAHAHNLYLSILFSSGIVGLTILLTGICLTIRRALSKQAHAAIGIVVFFLIYGITEPTIGGIVSFLSMSFYAIPCLLIAPGYDIRELGRRFAAANPFRFQSVTQAGPNPGASR